MPKWWGSLKAIMVTATALLGGAGVAISSTWDKLSEQGNVTFWDACAAAFTPMLPLIGSIAAILGFVGTVTQLLGPKPVTREDAEDIAERHGEATRVRVSAEAEATREELAAADESLFDAEVIIFPEVVSEQGLATTFDGIEFPGLDFIGAKGSSRGRLIFSNFTSHKTEDAGSIFARVSLDHPLYFEVGDWFHIVSRGRSIGSGRVTFRNPNELIGSDSQPHSGRFARSAKRRRSNPSGDVSHSLITAEVENAISFYFATSRNAVDVEDGWFGPGRASSNSYGLATVHVPAERRYGSLNRPFKLSLFSIALYEGSENPKKHFIVEKIETLDLESWKTNITARERSDALIFVHGFNTSFKDAILRAGQIFWDLQYDGVPVLFSWASGGGLANYLYDQGSATDAGENFRTLLAELTAAGITRVNVLCHSMGNYLLLHALDGYYEEIAPFNLTEIMMAAADVDRDVFSRMAPALSKAVPGLTLYASAHDRALLASMKLAGNIPRAGFVVDGKPLVVSGVDTIDVSEIGEEIFGLGHGAYASQASILNDIALLLGQGTRPPGKRLAQLRGQPTSRAPQWWSFQA